jgi:hypothetical protein
MGGHLGGKPETSDDQHHTLDEHAVSAHDEAWRNGRLDEMIEAHSAAARELANGEPDDEMATYLDAGGRKTPADEPFERWARRQLGTLTTSMRNLGEDLEIHLERGDERGRDMRLTEGRIVEHAAAQGWPVVRCGEGCGFIATAPDNAVGADVHTLLSTHSSACPLRQRPPTTPSLARLVVGCTTFIAILIIIAAVVEDIAGVR